MNELQQRLNVLADVVIARGSPEFFGPMIVVLKREMGDFLQVLRMQFHIHPTRGTVCLALAAWDQRWWKRPGGSIHAAAHKAELIRHALQSITIEAPSIRMALSHLDAAKYPVHSTHSAATCDECAEIWKISE